MARRIVIRERPFDLSAGLVVAAVVAVIYWRITDDFTWWMLVICIVLSFVVDKIVHKKTKEPGVYIE